MFVCGNKGVIIGFYSGYEYLLLYFRYGVNMVYVVKEFILFFWLIWKVNLVF